MGTKHSEIQAVSIDYCAERRRLLEAFTETVQDLGVFQNQQVEALLEGDEDFGRFDILLHLAADRKSLAKYAYMAHVQTRLHHVQTHGCTVKESQAA